MAELKTKPTEVVVDSFLADIPQKKVRDDSYTLIAMMEKITGEQPKMWGPSIIGFGKYHYKYDSGHEGDICLTGFSPRKANLSLYVLSGFPGQEQLLSKLGKHEAGKGCLYVKKLDDINLTELEHLINESVNFLKERYSKK